jgi:hypothetical protein
MNTSIQTQKLSVDTGVQEQKTDTLTNFANFTERIRYSSIVMECPQLQEQMKTVKGDIKKMSEGKMSYSEMRALYG